MKYCSKCGNQIEDNVNFCPKCGVRMQNQNSGLKTAAFVFMVLACVSCIPYLLFIFLIDIGVSIAALEQNLIETGGKIAIVIANLFFVGISATSIIFTCLFAKKNHRGEQIGVGFKIVVLIFCSIIAGILLLCDNEYICYAEDKKEYNINSTNEQNSSSVKVIENKSTKKAINSNDWVCPKCGKSNYKDARMCIMCGEERPSELAVLKNISVNETNNRNKEKTINANGWVCPKCGRTNHKDAKMCIVCGAERPKN